MKTYATVTRRIFNTFKVITWKQDDAEGVRKEYFFFLNLFITPRKKKIGYDELKVAKKPTGIYILHYKEGSNKIPFGIATEKRMAKVMNKYYERKAA
jgi:hypothetical protein